MLEELSTALAREDRLFHAVLHEVDLSKIRSKGLHYLAPGELRRHRSLSGRNPADRRRRLVAAERRPNGRRHDHADAGRHGASHRSIPSSRSDSALWTDDLERLTGSLLATLSQRGHYQIALSRNAAVVRRAERTEQRIPAGQGRAARLRAAAAGAEQGQQLHRRRRSDRPLCAS